MRNVLVALALVASLSTSVFASNDAIFALKTSLGFEEERVVTSLSTLLQSPKAYYNKDVTLKVLYRGPGKLFLPNLSAFTSEQYLNFNIWPDGSTLWTNKGVRSLFSTCYLSKYNDNFNKLRSMPMYTPILITARVDGVVENMPLLDVKTVTFLKEPRLTNHGIQQIRKAYAWYGEKRYDASAQHFNRALQNKLPLWATLEVKAALADISYDLELYDQARAQYLAVLQAGGNKEYVLPRLIKACLQSSNENALTNMNLYGASLVTINPSDAWGHLATGIAFYQTKENRPALSSLQRSLFRDLHISHTYLWKGRTYVALGEAQLAISTFLEGLALYKNDIKLTSDLAETYLRESQYKKALPYFKKLTRFLVPTSAHFPWRMAQCKLGLNDEKGAIKALEIALDRDAKHLNALLTLGGIHFSNKRYPEAKNYLTRAIAVDPTALEAHVKLGLMAWDLKDLNQAERHFDRVLVLNPDHLRTLLYMGKVNGEQGKIDLCLQRYSHLVALTPLNYPVRLDLAQRAQKAKRHELAVIHFAVLSEQKPYREESLYALAISNTALQLYERAQHNFELLIVDNPKNVAALNNVSYLCSTKTHKYALALSYALRAEKLAAKNPSVLDTLGLAYYYNNNFQTSYDTLLKAQKLDKKSAFIPYHISLALAGLQQYDAALKTVTAIETKNDGLLKDIETLKTILIETIARLKAEAEAAALLAAQQQAEAQKQAAKNKPKKEVKKEVKKTEKPKASQAPKAQEKPKAEAPKAKTTASAAPKKAAPAQKVVTPQAEKVPATTNKRSRRGRSAQNEGTSLNTNFSK